MRKSAWSRRLVPMIIGSVAVILSMEVAAPASADTNPAQPSLKELVQKRSKVNQVGGSPLSESQAAGCRLGSNANAFLGGFRMWEPATSRKPHTPLGPRDDQAKKAKGSRT